ncbi:MAG: macrolide transporter subunit MacA [Geobacteraceae bacterium]|nr:macrolide transporter subunit MacA [Geobacteraceae bacterium]
MRKIKRKQVIIILIAAAVLLVTGILGKKLLFSRDAPAFITASVTRMDIEESVLASGTMEALKTVDVGAQVSGQLKKLYVKLGDEVRKGQLLAVIDPVLQENSLKDAEASRENVAAQIKAKKALLRQYDLAYKRQKELAAQDAGSRADLETAQAQYDTTRADLAALEAQHRKAKVAVETAKANLDYTRIVAPMDGVVIGIVTEEGQTVNSAQTAPTILKLANLGTMTVKAEISEADVIKVKPGQKVYFTILGDPDTRHYGVLRAIEPATEAASSTSSTSSSSSSSSTAIYYNGLFDVRNPDRKLRVSMTAQVAVVLSEARQVLSIPVSALRDKGKNGQQKVKVLVNGKAEDRTVRVGISNNVNVQLISGLREGEKVIIGDAASQVSTSSSAGQHPGPPPGRR